MKSYPLRRKIIFDIGMHSGQDTEFYLKKGFWVVAVEANQDLVAEAAIRFEREIREGRLRIEPFGLGEKAGVFDFFISENSVFSSFERELGERDGLVKTVRVPMITLEALFEKYGVPYYMKVDIEGNDGFIFETLRNSETRPVHVSVENGFLWMLEAFRDLGYTKYKFVNQADVADQTLPDPAREGAHAAHAFEFGSSGAFGEEAPGEWLDFSRAKAAVEAYWSIPDRDATIHGWYDLHAARE